MLITIYCERNFAGAQPGSPLWSPLARSRIVYVSCNPDSLVEDRTDGERERGVSPVERERERERELTYSIVFACLFGPKSTAVLRNRRFAPSKSPNDILGGQLAGGFDRPLMPWGRRERERERERGVRPDVCVKRSLADLSHTAESEDVVKLTMPSESDEELAAAAALRPFFSHVACRMPSAAAGRMRRGSFHSSASRRSGAWPSAPLARWEDPGLRCVADLKASGSLIEAHRLIEKSCVAQRAPCPAR